MPVIVLKKSTPKEAGCTVFEKVNTGGVPLNVFELLTARLGILIPDKPPLQRAAPGGQQVGQVGGEEGGVPVVPLEVLRESGDLGPAVAALAGRLLQRAPG